MKIIYLLTVFFYLPDGSFVDGNQVDGYSPRAYQTAKECEERMKFASKQPMPKWAGGRIWTCHAAPTDWQEYWGKR
jgi:hypothetical protein